MGGVTGWMRERLCDSKGQATVEAALALPVVFLLLLILAQPAIILYDRVVMSQAASEGCRVLMTSGGSSGDARVCEDFVRRRLSAVPQQDCFHVHGDECSWDIELTGSSASETVGVVVSTEVKPLPLLDVAAAFAGMVNERGNLVVKVEVVMSTQPSWLVNTGMGSGATSWVGAWLRG